MKVLRLLLAVSACAIATNVLAATAVADEPTKFEESVAGEQFGCGDTLITITEGMIVGQEHVHELDSGLFRVIFRGHTQGVRATDEAGNEYRIVGSFGGNFTTPNPEQEGEEVGFFRVKLNIIGERGLFGTVDFSERRKPNGEATVTDRGSCQFVEPDEG